MKYRILLPVLFVCLLTNASYAQFTFDTYSTVIVSHDQPLGKIRVDISSFYSFPALAEPFYATDSLVAQKKEIVFRCPTRSLQIGFLDINNKQLQLLLKPTDTIYLYLDGQPDSLTLTYTGKTKAIQEYYAARAAVFPVRIGQQMMNAGIAAKDLTTFTAKADELYEKDKLFWKHYNRKVKLPDWFIRYESDAIRHQNGEMRAYILGYQQFVQNKNAPTPEEISPIPPGYLSFPDLTIDNAQAMYDHGYMHFLLTLFNYQAMQGTGKPDREKEFKLAKEKLSDDLFGYYKLFSIGFGLINDPVKVKQDLAGNSFPKQYDYLVDFLKTSAETNIEKLAPTASAPNFYLENEIDSLVSLDEFKGQVTYLSFWFPGCKGCIHEFPHENDLVDKFAGQPVKIVSICTMGTKSQWENMINKYNLKTTNLFANEAWRRKLEEGYVIKAYPHYTLIGADGRVIENFASRPSGDAAKQIEMALKEGKVSGDERH